MMDAVGRYPRFEETDDDDDDDLWHLTGDEEWPSSNAFARHEHALEALRAGDIEVALETVAECDTPDKIANALAAEAAARIRAGRLDDAELTLVRASNPKFDSVRSARDAYRRALAAHHHRVLIELLSSRGLEFAP